MLPTRNQPRRSCHTSFSPRALVAHRNPGTASSLSRAKRRSPHANGGAMRGGAMRGGARRGGGHVPRNARQARVWRDMGSDFEAMCPETRAKRASRGAWLPPRPPARLPPRPPARLPPPARRCAAAMLGGARRGDGPWPSAFPPGRRSPAWRPRWGPSCPWRRTPADSHAATHPDEQVAFDRETRVGDPSGDGRAPQRSDWALHTSQPACHERRRRPGQRPPIPRGARPSPPAWRSPSARKGVRRGFPTRSMNRLPRRPCAAVSACLPSR